MTLHAMGVTGVPARLETPDGLQAVRSGVADLDTGEPVPPDPYIRIGSTRPTPAATGSRRYATGSSTRSA
jgi:D-alanyl-D-alanine carboxypeptidase